MLDQAARRGDLITATHPKTVAVITGQVATGTDDHHVGDAVITIQLPPPLPGNLPTAQMVTVNTNYWDVTVLYANLIGDK